MQRWASDKYFQGRVRLVEGEFLRSGFFVSAEFYCSPIDFNYVHETKEEAVYHAQRMLNLQMIALGTQKNELVEVEKKLLSQLKPSILSKFLDGK